MIHNKWVDSRGRQNGRVLLNINKGTRSREKWISSFPTLGTRTVFMIIIEDK